MPNESICFIIYTDGTKHNKYCYYLMEKEQEKWN